jgi:hypothetical protein
VTTRKSAARLDRAETRGDKPRVLRVRLSTGLARAIQRRSGVAVFQALQHGKRDYMFESSDAGAVRAFWIALTAVYYHAPSGSGGRAIAEAAGAKRAELLATIQDVWPEALTE